MFGFGYPGYLKRTVLLAISMFVCTHLVSAKEIGPGDLSQWVGAYPFEAPKGKQLSFLQLPLVRAQMQALLPRPRVKQIDNLFIVSTPAASMDGYIVVRGCQAHACGNYYAAAYSQTTGDAVFLFLDELTCYSKAGTLKFLPESVKRELTRGYITWNEKRRKQYEELSCSVAGKPSK